MLRDPGVVESAALSVFVPENVRGATLVVAVVVGGKGPTELDAGRAAQNMMLAAWNEGVGSCPNGVSDAVRLASAVGQNADERIAIVLSFGYPARQVDPGRHTAEQWIDRADRRRFEEIVEER